jgi:hypothetical protein
VAPRTRRAVSDELDIETERLRPNNASQNSINVSQNLVPIAQSRYSLASAFWDNARMRVGYARGSRQDQRLESQRDALSADGCERIFEEKVSSREAERQVQKVHIRRTRGRRISPFLCHSRP